MSSVETGGLHTVSRRATWWSATVQWRNWPLLVKLGMVLVVPVVGALVLGVLRVKADVELSSTYRATERVAVLRTQFVSVLAAVEHERGEALRAGGQLAPAAKATDRAVAAMKDAVRRDPDLGDPTSGYGALVRALDTLPAARRQVTSGADGMIVLSAYNAVTNPVLEYDRSLVGRFPDEDLAGASLALAELQGMSEQVALQQAIGSLALRDHALPDLARQLLVEADVRLDDKLDDFRSQAPPDLTNRYEMAVQGDNAIAYQRLVDALRTTDPAALPFNQEQWDRQSNATVELMKDLTRHAATSLRSDSGSLAESISNRAGLESVLLLAMVLLAAGIGGGVGRYLLRSVGQLRRTALDVAHKQLPAAVASIRRGEHVVLEPVPLTTTEEFGQLARAFDAVNDQAVRSAEEEASLRGKLANIFTNLSRRSQGLVERQLRLMEQLEQRTDDPEQLENLFKIDHLATRMRRNNENLMVLSGTGLLRRFAEPMPLPDVLRAAISEVEHYQRAVVRSVPDVRIAGYAAGDLIRSISELIENATAFSPPDAQVMISGRLLQDGSVVIDIVDRGVSMGEKELAEANEKIAGGGGGVDVPISRQMGLFVVGRLTARHGIHVRLVPRSEGGLCASVLVPSGLVNIADPGQTAVLGMPLVEPGPAMNGVAAAVPTEPPPAERTGEPWLTPAAGTTPVEGSGAGRSMAASWLAAAKKAESGADGEPGGPEERAATGNWLETARGGAQVPAHAPAPDERATAAGWRAAARRAAADEPTPPADSDGTAEPEVNGAAGRGEWALGAAEATGGGAEPATTTFPAVAAATPVLDGDDAPTQVGLPAVRRAEPASLPYEPFEPDEVARQLESAGIAVTLPVLPDADTPASILFADNTVGDDGGEAIVGDGREPGFSWLRTRSGARPAAAPSAPEKPVVTAGPAGLPKRVPKAQLRGAAAGKPPAMPRNAERARGFMSGLQAGIRQSEDRKGGTGS
ncbi:nitrate- and nitrite sensing domain-containing protein [Actinophytocola sp.]|uniref:sensor histidine kinase n=1 Tax=Actinophytocola sp. TaxID=1872138 RepID=UPI00389AE7E6